MSKEIRFALWIIVCAIGLSIAVAGYYSQQAPPTLPADLTQLVPIPLSDGEKTEQENIELRAEILNRDQQALVGKWMRAHNLDPTKYDYNRQMRTFIPTRAAAPPAPPPAPPSIPKAVTAPADKPKKK